METLATCQLLGSPTLLAGPCLIPTAPKGGSSDTPVVPGASDIIHVCLLFLTNPQTIICSLISTTFELLLVTSYFSPTNIQSYLNDSPTFLNYSSKGVFIPSIKVNNVSNGTIWSLSPYLLLITRTTRDDQTEPLISIHFKQPTIPLYNSLS